MTRPRPLARPARRTPHRCPASPRHPAWPAWPGDRGQRRRSPPERPRRLAALDRHRPGRRHLALRRRHRGHRHPLGHGERALRAQGLIVAWRDEPYGVWDDQEVSHATIERAASRFWGTLTLGAHCNGYVADALGRPTHLWVAQRSLNKPTDPGMLDNLIGGGVPLGQSPWEALQREAFEEAGLAPDEIALATPGRVVALHCDIPEGLQREHLHVYDLRLPAGRAPQNQDGEVAWHQCWPVAEALAAAAEGRFTTDAALATLDFAVRHGVVAAHDPLAVALEALVAGAATGAPAAR
ncbi:MAG: NUDIX domain-containing protein [Comamonadaceae bacterium]|nr:NUDIX domain-containing protein [Comamonadaceae bacterium]